MKNTLLLLIVLLSTCVNAQTKKPISTKPSTKKPTKPEIDKLYEKYKDS